MNASADSHSQDHLFATGNRCLLLIMGQRFLVSIQRVTDNTIEVSFPVRDFSAAPRPTSAIITGAPGAFPWISRPN